MATFRNKEFIWSGYIAHPYRGGAELQSLIHFAQQRTRARFPHPSYFHAGDIVWQLYAFDTSQDVQIWRSAGGDNAIAACAIFEPPLNFQFELDPTVADERTLMTEIIRWAEQRRALVTDKDEIPLAYQTLGNDTLSTIAMDADRTRIALLLEKGYAPRQKAGIRFARSLDDPLPDVVLPDGARFRHISDAEAADRAELHRDAWSVWGRSKHSAERYRRLRSAPLYDPALDVVLEFEGQLVSYCVCWLDTANRVGSFEPVGTRPSAAGRGFGRAVIHEGLRRLRESGMRTAIVGTASMNKPAAALYASAGFEVVEREHFYVKADAM